MKTFLALLLASLGLLTGCESVPANRSVTMQRIDNAILHRAASENLVTKRLQEHQHQDGSAT